MKIIYEQTILNRVKDTIKAHGDKLPKIKAIKLTSHEFALLRDELIASQDDHYITRSTTNFIVSGVPVWGERQ